MNQSQRELRAMVRDAYSYAALRPRDRHAFPVGRAFADALGYPGDLLHTLPAESVEAFSGVSNVSIFAEIPVGGSILDAGCGAGLDALIASRRAGPRGRTVGVDFSEPMLARAHCAAVQAAAANVIFCQAAAEELPLADASVQVALVNGIFNLNPARSSIFRELARVLVTGGAVFGAELILTEPLPPPRLDRANWFG